MNSLVNTLCKLSFALMGKGFRKFGQGKDVEEGEMRALTLSSFSISEMVLIHTFLKLVIYICLLVLKMGNEVFIKTDKKSSLQPLKNI